MRASPRRGLAWAACTLGGMLFALSALGMTYGSALQLEQGAAAGNAADLAQLRQAAQGGSPAAETVMGELEVHTHHDRQALQWTRKAAEQNDARADYDLGFAYQVGLGVPENPAQSFAWYRRAARAGFTGAQNTVGNSFY